MHTHTKKRLLALLKTLTRKIEHMAQTPSAHRLRGMTVQLDMLMRTAEEVAETRYAARFRTMSEALSKLSSDATPQVLRETCGLLADLAHLTEDELAREREGLVFAFLPYKASMWDSLESIWRAADSDPDCRAIVMPIPYAERNADGTARTWHDESALFPEDVPTVASASVDLAQLHPDAIFVHNPYDNYNSATSVDMVYYSGKLKEDTDCLVYVPYYVTSGGTGEFQRSLASYANFDAIVVQAEATIPYFDESVRDKLLPLGSPKLDRIVRVCAHPPVPPEDWRKRMEGRTVYFYNTSIAGLLDNTERFYNKMKYVFSCFRGRTDACLLWRPHPLFWTSLKSMRPDFVPRFEALRDAFVAEGHGILDTTPDIEQTIALSDVYIGDAGTSVTALFGAAGKAIFVLNNLLHTAPDADDARTVYAFWPGDVPSPWRMLPDNSVWHAGADGVFHFCCRLSRYHAGGYYSGVLERGGKVYAIPSNGLSVPVIEHGTIARTIALRDGDMPYGGRFAGGLVDRADETNQRYLFLRPFRYPDLVRIDTQTDEVTYIGDVQSKHAAKTGEGDWIVGGSAYLSHLLYFSSPLTPDVLVLDDRTLERQTLTIGDVPGANVIAYDETDGSLWLLPMKGYTIRRWKPMTGELRTYDARIDGLMCTFPRGNVPCDAQPFCQAVFTADSVILAPLWGNKFVQIDKASGRAAEWVPPAPFLREAKDGYFFTTSPGAFAYKLDATHWTYFSNVDRRLYRVDLVTRAYEELSVRFDIEEVRQHMPGFSRNSEWIQYCCEENALQSLPMLLDGTLPGAPFDAAAEREAYGEVAVNIGTCGERVYETIKNNVLRRDHQ